nr:ComEC/Rec2 family competence protein [Rhizomicrobium palustre]
MCGFVADGLRNIRASALSDRIRWPLWLPVAQGAGIGWYFALLQEPPLKTAYGALAMALLAGVLAVFSPSARLKILLALVAAFALGFGTAKLRSDSVAAPVLTERIGPLHITALVVGSEPRGYGSRLLLEPFPIDRLGARTPKYIRLTVRAHSAVPRPGDWVEVIAILMPPPEPSMPGDYDFGRWAYFQQIGAVGYLYGVPQEIAPPRLHTLLEKLRAGLEDLRGRMTARVRSIIPGRDGVISAALITGQRVDIDASDQTAFRDSGLMHVLSISGLHLALAGGFFFWTIRAFFALFPSIVLRHPIKKWAAIGALAGSTFYLLISGCEAPAVRSWIMLAVMFCAILVDRPALSMRSVALSAGFILLVTPENMLDPGCQMSFAAVIGLIAFAEWSAAHRGEETRKSWLFKAWQYLGGICITSIIAGLCTAPIAIFHFDRASPFGILANLAALPVVGAVIMPAATAAMVLMPFGLDEWTLIIMGKGVAVMMAIAHWVAALPGAGTVVPAWPGAAVAAVMTGGLWIAFWRKSWRWLGLLPVLGGIAFALTAEPPDLLVARDGRTVALRLNDGRFGFIGKVKDRYAAENWLRRAGDERKPDEAIGGAGMTCDALGCIARLRGATVAVDLRAEALGEDCTTADILVSATQAHGFCVGPKLVIDRSDLDANGAYAVRFNPLTVETVAGLRGQRPWSGRSTQPSP